MGESEIGAAIREQLCRELRGLEQTIHGSLGTAAGWEKQTETILVEEYNDIVGRAVEHGLRSTREADLGLTYRDLLAAIGVQLRRLECPEPRFQLMSDEFMRDLG